MAQEMALEMAQEMALEMALEMAREMARTAVCSTHFYALLQVDVLPSEEVRGRIEVLFAKAALEILSGKGYAVGLAWIGRGADSVDLPPPPPVARLLRLSPLPAVTSPPQPTASISNFPSRAT